MVQSASTDPAIVLKAVADAAAATLLENLADGMTITVSGGVALCAVIEALAPARKYDVRVVPATGGVQGKFRTDVNHVAVALAEKLGGTAYQLHAPVFAASEEERAALMSVSTIRNVLEMARNGGCGAVRHRLGARHRQHLPHLDRARRTARRSTAPARRANCSRIWSTATAGPASTGRTTAWSR